MEQLEGHVAAYAPPCVGPASRLADTSAGRPNGCNNRPVEKQMLRRDQGVARAGQGTRPTKARRGFSLLLVGRGPMGTPWRSLFVNGRASETAGGFSRSSRLRRMRFGGGNRMAAGAAPHGFPSEAHPIHV
jgi:hypothetical protein